MDLAAEGGFCNLYIELGHMTCTVNIKSYFYLEKFIEDQNIEWRMVWLNDKNTTFLFLYPNHEIE